MKTQLMKCGCVGMAVDKDGNPACISHDCHEVALTPPDLEGRTAQCGYKLCTNPRPSSYDLAFFVYQGPGSPYSETMCKCGFYEVAHVKHPNGEPTKPERSTVAQYRGKCRVCRSSIKVGETIVLFRKTWYHKDCEPKIRRVCGEFTAIGPVDDQYYCGCRGWD